MSATLRNTVVIAVACAALALPAAASAHNLSYGPRSGDIASTFTFSGTAWQPGQRVVITYFANASLSTISKSFAVAPAGNGRFRFRFVRPQVFNSEGVTARMCFAQFDTRVGRTFRKCGLFYVAPASAFYQPVSGRIGDRFALIAQGFPAGTTLSATVTFPTGATDSFTMTTVSRPTFVQGSRASVLLPRGGAIHVVTSTNSGFGYYVAEVRAPNGQTASAVTRLLP